MTVLSLATLACLSAATNPSAFLARHPIWIQENLSWERDPGDKQSWAGGSVLYFGKDGTFGRFGGIVLRRNGKFSLSEGEGGVVYRGSWAVKNGVVHVDYRVVDRYKVANVQGQEPPPIPGPIQQSEVSVARGTPPRVTFDGKIFEPAPRFDRAQLEEILRIFPPERDTQSDAK
jgi:hypothetical protein